MDSVKANLLFAH